MEVSIANLQQSLCESLLAISGRITGLLTTASAGREPGLPTKDGHCCLRKEVENEHDERKADIGRARGVRTELECDCRGAQQR